ncbi:MAG: TetR/AcrR family transcriptional regulator [Verrucomicrobiota bacterium]
MSSNSHKSSTGREERIASYVHKATGLFAAKGYRQVGVQEIIDCLGISKGGFYCNFSSKEDFYIQICKAHCSENRKLFEDLMEGKELSPETINTTAVALLEWFLDHPVQIRLMIDFHNESDSDEIRHELKRLNNEWTEVITSLVNKCKQHGFISVDIPSKMIASQYIVFFTGLLLLSVVDREKESILQQWKAFLKTFFVKQA